MGKLIDKIWESDIEFYDYSDNDLKELLELMQNSREKLEVSLDNRQKELFYAYTENSADYNADIEKRAFCKALR